MDGDFHHWRGEDLILNIYLQPRAGTDAWAGRHGDSLKLRVTAPPVEGRANAHLRKLLAKWFGVPQSRVTLISGETSRHKCLRIASPSKLPPEIPFPHDRTGKT